MLESFNVDDQDVKIAMSTSRLLRHTTVSEMLQADATYKLCWQGYPILIVGTSDIRDHTFHPIALAVCARETADPLAVRPPAAQLSGHLPSTHPIIF